MGYMTYIHHKGLERELANLQELTNNAAKYARLWIGQGKSAARQDDLRDFSAWKR
ncbi:hypothetical protein ACE6H2_025863 [Prunus campanulata]